MNPAVELSYLSSQQQEHVLTAMQSEQSSPSLAQARQLCVEHLRHVLGNLIRELS